MAWRPGMIYDFAIGVNNDTECAGACFAATGHTLFVNHYGELGTLPLGRPGNLPGAPSQVA